MSRVAEAVEQAIKKSLGKTKFGINDLDYVVSSGYGGKPPALLVSL